MSFYSQRYPQQFSNPNLKKKKEYKLPSLFDFDENNKYSESKYSKIIENIIEKIVSKSDNKKVFYSIQHGFNAINIFITTMQRYFSGSKKELNYDTLNSILLSRHKIEKDNKSKKKFGVIFNPFYFIMIYQILKNKKIEILEDEDADLLSKYKDLDFDVDALDDGQQNASLFNKNAWRVIKNLLEMLYGKYNNRNPKSITFMSSILKYLYALFLETVQITQSIDDALLLPDCAVNITVLENKNFLTRIFTQCNNLSQMGGGSRSTRKKQNPCKTSYESTSTITRMLTENQNIICELIKFTLLEINKFDNDSQLIIKNVPEKIDNQTLINTLSKVIIYDIEKKENKKYDNVEANSYYIDNVPFYKKLFKLYLDIARDILSNLKKYLTNKKDSFDKKNKRDKIREFEYLIKQIENSEKSLNKIQI